MSGCTHGIVKDLNGQGHAIPTVTAHKGEVILDNLIDDVHPRNAIGYRFLKRQSQEDPDV